MTTNEKAYIAYTIAGIIFSSGYFLSLAYIIVQLIKKGFIEIAKSLKVSSVIYISSIILQGLIISTVYSRSYFLEDYGLATFAFLFLSIIISIASFLVILLLSKNKNISRKNSFYVLILNLFLNIFYTILSFGFAVTMESKLILF